MKLTKREIAWEKRKKKSGPSYDEYGKARGQFEERLKKAKSYPAFSKERYELEEWFNKKYDRYHKLRFKKPVKRYK